MSEINLSQAEADTLIAMEKQCVDNTTWAYPTVGGGSLSVPLMSADKRENFLLDIYRGRIDLRKSTFQNRARQIICLIRLDIGNSAPHTNPDGEQIPCPHIHIYREGYGHKWAFQIPANFKNIDDIEQTMRDFMDYCNITKKPDIRFGLF